MLARSPALTQGAERRRRLALILLAAICILVLDHLSKWLVSANMPLGTSVALTGIVSISHTENSGAAFGLLSQFQYVYILVAAGVACYILFAGPKLAFNTYRQIVLGAILGGATSNGIDRLIFGRVTDFIDFHFWPVFNVADSAIVVAMVLAFLTFRDNKSIEPAE